jgi:protein-tyrosine-phosphatase
MGGQELENLVKIGRLKAEVASRREFEGMVKSARRGLSDAQNKSIDSDSQFDLAIEAAHKFALAALRQHGYRSEDRTTVFQALVHTLGIDSADLIIFLRAHNERNLAAYEGRLDIDQKLVDDLISATKRLETAVGKLARPSA